MLLGREMSGTVLGKLYDNLKTALEDIHNKHKTKLEQKLISIIGDFYKKCADDHVTCGVIRLNKFCALQMVLWNCIYYNFYEQEVYFHKLLLSGKFLMYYLCRDLHKQFLIHWQN